MDPSKEKDLTVNELKAPMIAHHHMYRTACFALTKIAAKYHREFYQSDVDAYGNELEAAVKKSKRKIDISKDLRAFSNKERAKQAKLTSIHTEYEKKLMGAGQAQFQDFSNFFDAGINRMLASKDHNEVIQLLDMYNQGLFDDMFVKLKEDARKAFEESGLPEAILSKEEEE